MSKKHVGDKPWQKHIQLGRRKPGQGTPADEPETDTRKPPGWQGRAAKAKQRREGNAPRSPAAKPATPAPTKPTAMPSAPVKPVVSIPAPKAPRERPLDGEGRPYITLVQFLKTIDAVDTGGAGKHAIRAGGILVNGTEELRPARKLHEGDTVTIAGAEHRVVL
jgi:ribosome-associated protein YbcJ (S4-like RNA binding protein)